MTFGALLLAVHVLGAIAWVGGMFFALAVLRPSMGFLESPLRLALHEQVFRRFFFIIWHIMPVMLVTGIAMEFLFYGGFATTPWPLQLMTVTGVAMAVLFVAIVSGPWRSLRQSLARRETSQAGAAVQRIRLLVTINLALGVFTTIVAMFDF